MSILNAKSNMFVIWFPKNFFYPEVRERWTPIIKRLKLPYETLEDYFNATVQSVTFPDLNLKEVTQPQTMFNIKYRGGKELEPTMDKTVTVSFKLTEGFISYWLIFDQIELYQKYSSTAPFWPSMYVSFLDHHGFELMAFEFQKIVPNTLSKFTVNYATVISNINVITLGLFYNRYRILRRVDDKTYNFGIPNTTGGQF